MVSKKLEGKQGLFLCALQSVVHGLLDDTAVSEPGHGGTKDVLINLGPGSQFTINIFYFVGSVPLVDYPWPQHWTRGRKRRPPCCSGRCCRRRIESDVGITGSAHHSSRLNVNGIIFIIRKSIVACDYSRFMDFVRYVASVGKGLHSRHKTLDALTGVGLHECFRGCPCWGHKFKLW